MFHPLVLWINGRVQSEDHKVKLFMLVESYIVRREICGLTPKNYNKVVTSWIRAIRQAAEPLFTRLDIGQEALVTAGRMGLRVHVRRRPPSFQQTVFCK